MPTGFPRSPRLQKGAIVFYQLPDLLPNIIVFQYNPDEVTHSLQGKSGGSGGVAMRTESMARWKRRSCSR
jgi:hypothetical protein